VELEGPEIFMKRGLELLVSFRGRKVTHRHSVPNLGSHMLIIIQSWKHRLHDVVKGIMEELAAIWQENNWLPYLEHSTYRCSYNVALARSKRSVQKRMITLHHTEHFFVDAEKLRPSKITETLFPVFFLEVEPVAG
jgi:hypothetical protein